MKVWIENPFDNLPCEGYRPQRYWLMARAFAAAGHEVTLITSDFSHANKAPRQGVGEGDGFRLVLLPTRPYARNVCWVRVRSHRAYAATFAAWARRTAAETGRPDLLIVSTPPLATGAVAIALRQEFGCRLVVDVQDAWPETFGRLFATSRLGRLARACGLAYLLLAPMRRAARRLYRAADCVTGVAERYAVLVRQAGAREYRLFRHGVQLTAGVPTVKPARPALVYAGTLGVGYDLGPVIDAVKAEPDWTFDVAGAGERLAEWQARAGDCPRIRFHGYLGATALAAVLDSASIGVIPMRDDSFVGLPYKLGDYAAHGLRVVTSLGGECAALLQQYQVGATYVGGDVASLTVAVRQVLALQPDSAGLAQELDAARIYADYVRQLLPST